MAAKVLIPVDGTRNSKQAEDFAIKLHEKMPLTAVLLNVINAKGLDGHGIDTGLKETILGRKREWSEKTLAEAAAGFKKAGIEYEKRIMTGDPANLICYTAQNEDFDMVIIAESGMSDFKDWYMGSVTNYVMYRCTIPVLLVKHSRNQ
jgi:nucleotide-binding universal stress UspA family protein